MLPVWPSDLPNIVMVDSFSLTIADGRMRAQTDTGPGRSYAVNTAPTTPIQAKLPINKPWQIGRFERFWRDDLGRGVRLFWIRDQVLDGLPLTDDDEVLLTDHLGNVLIGSYYWLAEFASTPIPVQARDSTGLYQMQFELLRHERPD